MRGGQCACISAKNQVVSCDWLHDIHAFGSESGFQSFGVWLWLRQSMREREAWRYSPSLHSHTIGWQTAIRCKFLTSESAGASPPSPLPSHPIPPPPVNPPHAAEYDGKKEGVNCKTGSEKAGSTWCTNTLYLLRTCWVLRMYINTYIKIKNRNTTRNVTCLL